MKIDVIIATYKPEGINRVSNMYLPVEEDVNYIISWQEDNNYPLPRNLKREDIHVYRCEGKGLSRNRNNGIEHSAADIVYIADDDIILMPDFVSIIKRSFEQYPDTEVATFKMKEGSFPDKITELTFYLPKNYSITAYQTAFKRELYPTIKFDIRYGINSGIFEAGEDELFHLTARKKGLKCRFFPEVLGSHPHASTGFRKIDDVKVLYSFGAVITKSYPRTFILRLPLKAYRLKKNNQYNFFGALFHLAVGSIKSMFLSSNY